MGLNIIIFQKNNITNSYALVVQSYNYGVAATKTIVPFSSTTTDPSLLVNYLNDSDYNLVIYDWSKTLNDSQLSGYLTTLMNASTPSWDVAYLGKWSDTCSKYNILNNVDYQPFILVNGSDPVGFNAVLLKPSFSVKLKTKINANPVNKYKSINYVINEVSTEEGNVNYIAFSPNLFVYDPLYNSVDDNVTYFAKTQECVSFNSQVTPPSDNALTIFWILLIILLVCVILWILFNSKSFGVQGKELTSKTYDL